MAKLKKTWIFLGIITGLIVLSVVISSIEEHSKQSKIAKEKEAVAAKKQKEKEEIRKYNIENKEAHYQKGLELVTEKKYTEALGMFNKVVSVDKSYKDVQTQIESIKATRERIKANLERIRKEEEIAEAKKMILEAGKLSISNMCHDLSKAIELSKKALKILPDSKNALSYLLKAQIEKLKCFEGNKELEMAIHILAYQPLKLQVSIKNISSKVRHANPTYLTMITVTNRSLSVSSKTYGVSGYFDAVDLQPGTKASGIIIFDTWDKPKKLIYSEMLGTTISRDFPFQE